jgi:hypothetical protein
MRPNVVFETRATRISVRSLGWPGGSQLFVAISRRCVPWLLCHEPATVGSRDDATHSVQQELHTHRPVRGGVKRVPSPENRKSRQSNAEQNWAESLFNIQAISIPAQPAHHAVVRMLPLWIYKTKYIVRRKYPMGFLLLLYVIRRLFVYQVFP